MSFKQNAVLACAVTAAVVGMGAMVSTPVIAATPPAGGYAITQIGLTGSGYEYTYNVAGGGTYRISYAQFLNNAGQVAGYSYRYNSFGSLFGQDAWLYNGTSTQFIGLTGSDYERTYSGTGGGTYRDSKAQFLNNAGQVAGYSTRYTSFGDPVGQDVWLYNGTSTQFIGLTGSDYERSYYTGTGVATYRNSQVQFLSNAGQAAGFSYRYSSFGDLFGQDVWLSNGTSTQRIGLTGSGYEYTTTVGGGGTIRNSQVQFLNDAGQAVGTSSRYDSSGTPMGYDAWLSDGTSTQFLGLTGGGYEFTSGSVTARASKAQFFNDAGQAAGYSARYTSSGSYIGQDAWFYSGTSTQVIGLTGSGHDYPSTGAGGGTFHMNHVQFLNNAGQAAGYSDRYNSSGEEIGQDVWLYNGTSTQQIGLTGSGYERTYSGTGGGVYRDSEVQFLNGAGQAAGYSYRYNSSGYQIGQDTWLYNGTNTQQIGLTGSGYEQTYSGTGGGMDRYGQVQFLNNAGQAAGFSYRYNNSGHQVGQDAWLSDGTSTQVIGLTGSDYEYAYTGTGGGVYRNSQVQFLNDAGQAAGVSTRYNSSGGSLGRDVWFFDEGTGLTTALRFSARSSDNYSSSDVALLTDTGVVLGSYVLFSGATDLGRHAYWWSLDDGFSDLGGLVDGGLTNAGWQSLYYAVLAAGTVPGGSPIYIAGYGQTAGQTGGQSAFLMTAIVPEPSSLGLLALGGGALLARRRRWA